ncbi:MAG: Rid family hydrolase [Candidatus Binatia bacterium]
MAPAKAFYAPKGTGWPGSHPGSAGVRVGDLLFISGQLSLGPGGDIAAPGDVTAQARNVFGQIQAIVEEAGGGLDDVLDLVSFHTDVRQLGDVVEAGTEFFKRDYPAWTAVGTPGTYVSGAAVCIKAIAHLGKEQKECFTPDAVAWLRALPLSAGCKKGNLMFLSGQVPTDAEGNLVAPGNHALQARQSFLNIKAVVEAAGGTLDDVIEILSFHVDPRGMELAGELVCSEVFGRTPLESASAWTAIGTPGLYAPGVLGEYRTIADFSPGKRLASTPDTIWWRVIPVSGGTKKAGGSLIAISGQVASDGDGNIIGAGDVEAQTRYDFEQIQKILAGFDATLDNVVEITAFHKDMRACETVAKVGAEYFPRGEAPAWTSVGTTGLWKEGYLHEIHALAVV